MYYLDAQHGEDGSKIYRTKAGFKYPLSKFRDGSCKVKCGEMLRVCMTSDFFLEEADPWRDEAWDIMRRRPDVIFFLLTKRPQKVVVRELIVPRTDENGICDVGIREFLCGSYSEIEMV